MPYTIIPVSSRRGNIQYAVINSITGKVHSKGTTLEKAKAQVRLLYAAESRKK